MTSGSICDESISTRAFFAVLSDGGPSNPLLGQQNSRLFILIIDTISQDFGGVISFVEIWDNIDCVVSY